MQTQNVLSSGTIEEIGQLKAELIRYLDKSGSEILSGCLRRIEEKLRNPIEELPSMPQMPGDLTSLSTPQALILVLENQKIIAKRQDLIMLSLRRLPTQSSQDDMVLSLVKNPQYNKDYEVSNLIFFF